MEDELMESNQKTHLSRHELQMNILLVETKP
jgi:hypothetical protein